MAENSMDTGLLSVGPEPETENRVHEADRRELDDRREDENFFGDADRRSLADRRQGARRKLTCGVLYTTSGAVTEIEDWLEDNCQGDFSLGIEDMDDELIKKSLKILFELETDKQRFIKVHV